jgi:hypothetical protein
MDSVKTLNYAGKQKQLNLLRNCFRRLASSMYPAGKTIRELGVAPPRV